MNQKTKDITLEWCRNAPEALIQTALSIDMKLIGILAASSVIISVAASLASINNNAFRIDWTLIPFAIAVVTYACNFLGILRQISPKEFWRTDDPNDPARNTDKYWSHNPEKARDIQWRAIQKNYRQNFSISENKAKQLKVSTILLGIQTLALVMWVVAGNIAGN